MRKYTLEQFMKKYKGKNGICCGINYIDGDKDLVMNISFSQILSFIRLKNKDVAFIASK
jgi:hypothetical protein